MKNFLAITLSICILLCLTACSKTENQSGAFTEEQITQKNCTVCGKHISETANYCEHCGAKIKETDTEETLNEHYNRFLGLIEAGKYDDAYKSLDFFEDKAKADELRNNFVVIEDVLIAQELAAVEDALGNKAGPFVINYKYDTSGRLIEIEAGSGADNVYGTNPFMRHVFTINPRFSLEKLSYDDDKLIKITGYSHDLGEIYYTVDYNYDNKGNVIKVVYTNNSFVEETLYKYNEDNQLIQYKSGNREIDIKYDDNGNIVEEGTVYDADGKITESIYDIYALGDFREGKCIWKYGDYYIYNE